MTDEPLDEHMARWEFEENNSTGGKFDAPRHTLIFDEDDDTYNCTCGETFHANGDIVSAFMHGFDVGLELGRE